MDADQPGRAQHRSLRWKLPGAGHRDPCPGNRVLAAALLQQITVAHGRVRQCGFADYPLLPLTRAALPASG